MQFDILDLIFVLGISQGIFLVFTIFLVPRNNKSANQVLSLLIMIAVIMLFGRIAMYRISEEWVYRVALFVDCIIFLVGPILYIYMRRLLFAESKYVLPWFHFLPAIIHILYNLYGLRYSIPEYVQFYKEGSLKVIFFVVEFIGLVSLSLYTVACLRILKKYETIKVKMVSYESKVLKFSRFIIVSMITITLIWAISFLLFQLFSIRFRYFNYQIVWIGISIFIYGIGFHSLRQPEVFRLVFEKSPQITNRLSPNKIQTLSNRLAHFMIEEKVYLQPELTLNDLADKIEATPNDLSWLLNSVFNQTFYEYINYHRLDEFIKKVEGGSHKKVTILSLALEAGFNSKSTFNKVFKNRTGQTPSFYIKQNFSN